jgi:transmembrane sensor
MTPARPIDQLLARSLKGEASPEEEATVRDWRRATPENEIEYLELARLVALAARIPELFEAPPRPSVAELIAPGRLAARVIPLRRRYWPSRRAWLMAAAAAVVLVVGSLVSRRRGREPSTTPALGIREIATAKTEAATFELADGTVIRLAPSSRLHVLAGRGRREVALEGRGFFAVAHDGTPFVIRTAAGDVAVLGTRLDLEARGRDLRVVVVEGHVALSTQRQRTQLTAGEMGRVRNGADAQVVRVPDIDAFVEWTGNFLAFQSTPLHDAAREIERVYGVRIEIPDSEVARRVITAWFRDKSLAEVMDVVCLAVAAHCSIESGMVRILPEAHGGGR